MKFKCPDDGIFEAVGYDNPVFLADTVANCPKCGEKCWDVRERVIEEAKEFCHAGKCATAYDDFTLSLMADFALLQYEAGERAATARIVKDLREQIGRYHTYRAQIHSITANIIEKLEEAAKTK